MCDSRSASTLEQILAKLAFSRKYLKQWEARSGSQDRCPHQLCFKRFPGERVELVEDAHARLGRKHYYFRIIFKANSKLVEKRGIMPLRWMHLACIDFAGKQRDLQEHIKAIGKGNGYPITYRNYKTREPNNFKYKDGEQEHCLETWDQRHRHQAGMNSCQSFYFIKKILTNFIHQGLYKKDELILTGSSLEAVIQHRMTAENKDICKFLDVLYVSRKTEEEYAAFYKSLTNNWVEHLRIKLFFTKKQLKFCDPKVELG